MKRIARSRSERQRKNRNWHRYTCQQLVNKLNKNLIMVDNNLRLPLSQMDKRLIGYILQYRGFPGFKDFHLTL
jgi:hypothetical protein